jgi:hypothetical protein
MAPVGQTGTQSGSSQWWQWLKMNSVRGTPPDRFRGV